MRRSALAFFTLVASAQYAFAGDVSGIWLHEDGGSKVRFAPCGAAVCGTIVWLKDKSGAGKVGQRVFYDMMPTGDNALGGQGVRAFERQGIFGQDVAIWRTTDDRRLRFWRSDLQVDHLDAFALSGFSW
jgi:uncharacterized protein (DUF2147 family)